MNETTTTTNIPCLLYFHINCVHNLYDFVFCVDSYQYLVHKVLLHVHNDPSVWPVDCDHEQTLDSYQNKALPIDVVFRCFVVVIVSI